MNYDLRIVAHAAVRKVKRNFFTSSPRKQKRARRTQASRFSLPQAHKGHREGNLTAYGCGGHVFVFAALYLFSKIHIQKSRAGTVRHLRESAYSE